MAIIKELATESKMVSDYDHDDVPEQPVIVCNYPGSECVSIVGADGDEVTVPYRLVNEVAKIMKAYLKN